jgi:hypothetical protein
MISIRAGEMLAIPPGWWHYVVSEPGTIMLNFWFDDVDEMLMAKRWSILLARAATTVSETSCALLAAASAADEADVKASALPVLLHQTKEAEAAVNRSATKLACVQTELELQQKIDEAAVEVAGLREWLHQTKAPVEVVNGSATEEVVVGNKEVPPVLAELSAVVYAAVVKGAAGELQPDEGCRVPRVSSIAVGTNENQIEVGDKKKTD